MAAVRSFLVVGFVLVTASAACSSEETSPTPELAEISDSTAPQQISTSLDELVRARDIWHDAQQDDYLLSFDIESQSRFQGRQWITVVDGRAQQTDFSIGGTGSTIDDWFAYIETNQTTAARFRARFDPTLGFPELIDVDEDALTTDDEFKISSVTVQPGNPIIELSNAGAIPDQLIDDAPPYGVGTRTGVGYQYLLLVECGLEWARIDGSWWTTAVARTSGSSNPPEGWDIAYDEGLLYLLDDTTADYQRRFGDSIRFTRTDPAAEPPDCD